MNKPHEHAEVIKAWADGAVIEGRKCGSNTWIVFDETPTWLSNWEYRVKSEPKLAGEVLATCYSAAIDGPASRIYAAQPAIWQETAKLFIKELDAGNVKRD